MSRFGKTILSVFLLPLLLTGCWDIKDLQEISYLTAMGFDIEGEEFVIYGQFLDFGSVAKTESSKSGTLPVWVGKGRGKTLVNAIDDLYRSSPLRIFYGHVNAIVLGEKLLKNKSAMNQAEQFHNRFYELRYTPWIFGTSEAMDELFSVTSIFNFSPGVSILHQPQETYKQRSLIQPISVREFSLEMNEPSHTVMLPSIAISAENWNKGNKPHELLTINGAYAIKNDKFLGLFHAEEILGLTWVEPHARRGPLVLSSGGKYKAALSLEQPNITIHPRVREGKAEYTIEIKLIGTQVMTMIPMSESELEREASELVRKQIREVYEVGIQRDADLLQLETALYRKKNGEWKKLRSREKLKLTPKSLTEITVSVKIKHTGNLKSTESLD
jgi:spore germination protein KC